MTTLWEDFRIADAFGVDAVIDTYKRVFDEYKNDVKYMAELTLVLNHSSWIWEDKNPNLCDIYVKLFYTHNDWCWGHFTNEEDADYYFRVTD